MKIEMTQREKIITLESGNFRLEGISGGCFGEPIYYLYRACNPEETLKFKGSNVEDIYKIISFLKHNKIWWE